MYALDILKYGHLTFLAAVEAIPVQHRFTTGVCGVWSVKDLVAHLASFEQVLVEVLVGLLGQDEPTPTLAAYIRDDAAFNDAQVLARRDHSLDDVLADYHATHTRVMHLAADLPADMFIAAGTLPWYGTQYSLDDFIVYAFYRHKREHAAQINAFATTLKTLEVVDAFNAAFNQRDIDAIRALMTPNVLFDNTSPAPDGQQVVGQEAVCNTFAAMFRATPTTHFAQELINAAGDHATVLWRYEWTDTQGVAGHVRGVDVLRVADGKIAEKRAYVKG